MVDSEHSPSGNVLVQSIHPGPEWAFHHLQHEKQDSTLVDQIQLPLEVGTIPNHVFYTSGNSLYFCCSLSNLNHVLLN